MFDADLSDFGRVGGAFTPLNQLHALKAGVAVSGDYDVVEDAYAQGF